MEEYIYIYAWHKKSGSFDYYINNLIEKAKAEKAPKTAVYYDNTKKRWVTLEECRTETQEHIKWWIHRYMGVKA